MCKASCNVLGLEIFLITANGAVVHDKQDNCIYNQTIPPKLAQELVEIERYPGDTAPVSG